MISGIPHQIVEAARDLASAMNKLNEAWDESRLTVEQNETMGERYPFALSFDEQVAEVDEWVGSLEVNEAHVVTPRYTFRKNDAAGLNDPDEYVGADVAAFWTMHGANGTTAWSLYEMNSWSRHYEHGRFAFTFDNSEPQFATFAHACGALALAYETVNPTCEEAR